MIDDFISEAEDELKKIRSGNKKVKKRSQNAIEKEAKNNTKTSFIPNLLKVVGESRTLEMASAATPILKTVLGSTGTLNLAISAIPVLKEVLSMTNEREDFLVEGKQYLEEMLGTQADYQISLKYEEELADVIQSDLNILSDEVSSNSKLSIPIRQKIESYRQEAKKYILLTSALIEKQKFEDFDEIASDIRAGESEKQKIELLFQGYRELSFSIETVKVAVDFFSMINKSIVDKVSSVSRTSPEYSDLMLKNAILVYEFTSFLIQYLEDFGIGGIDNIEQVKTDVEDKLKKAEDACKELEEDQYLDNDLEYKEQVRLKNAERRKIYNLVRQKWTSFENGINEGRKTTEAAVIQLLPNLKVRQKDAKIQLMTLEIVKLTSAFQSNVDLANKFADVKRLELAPLTAEDVRELFGIDSPKRLTS